MTKIPKLNIHQTEMFDTLLYPIPNRGGRCSRVGRGKCPVTSKTHDDKRRSWVSAADIQAATVGLYTHARLGRTSLRDASKSRTARTELTVRDRPANESSVTLTLK